MSKSKVPSADYIKRVYTLWPHLKDMPEPNPKEWSVWFYKFTYAYGNDPWEMRLDEGADNDEGHRICWAFKIALDNKFDGKGGRPSLSQFWHDLHQQVVCPLFKRVMSSKSEKRVTCPLPKEISDELEKRYISWVSETYKLDSKNLEKRLTHEKTTDDPEDGWIDDYFRYWIGYDRERPVLTKTTDASGKVSVTPAKAKSKESESESENESESDSDESESDTETETKTVTKPAPAKAPLPATKDVKKPSAPVASAKTPASTKATDPQTKTVAKPPAKPAPAKAKFKKPEPEPESESENSESENDESEPEESDDE